MAGKRLHTDHSAGLFVSRKYAADLLGGDIDSPGSFVEGHVLVTNPRKNLYTLDIRLDSKAKPVTLDVVIEDKLQRRMGELMVGDHLRISLPGAQLLPLSPGPSSHVPFKLRFVEGVTILLVSRAGPQGEKEKLFHVWPASSKHSIHSRASFNPLCRRRHRQAQEAKAGTEHRSLRRRVVLHPSCGRRSQCCGRGHFWNAGLHRHMQGPGEIRRATDPVFRSCCVANLCLSPGNDE